MKDLDIIKLADSHRKTFQDLIKTHEFLIYFFEEMVKHTDLKISKNPDASFGALCLSEIMLDNLNAANVLIKNNMYSQAIILGRTYMEQVFFLIIFLAEPERAASITKSFMNDEVIKHRDIRKEAMRKFKEIVFLEQREAICHELTMKYKDANKYVHVSEEQFRMSAGMPRFDDIKELDKEGFESLKYFEALTYSSILIPSKFFFVYFGERLRHDGCFEQELSRKIGMIILSHLDSYNNIFL